MALDEASLDAVLAHRVADPLAQATVWAALWAMVRAGDLPVRTFVAAVERLADTIAPVGVYTQVLSQAGSAVGLYAAAGERAALRGRLGDLLLRHVAGLEAGSDRQRAAARVLGLVARRDATLAARADISAARLGLPGFSQPQLSMKIWPPICSAMAAPLVAIEPDAGAAMPFRRLR